MENKKARDFTSNRKAVVVDDFFQEGIRCLILSLGSHFTAYLGIPIEHPYSGKDYDNVPLSVHGGLTFSSKGEKDTIYPDGFWWYGWDYAHLGDYYFSAISGFDEVQGEDNDWTFGEVKKEVIEAAKEFNKLIN